MHERRETMQLEISQMAGMLSTALFASAALPMVGKVLRTRDMRSYSPSHLGLMSVANVVHSAYVFSLPLGPIWVLHSIYLAISAFMVAAYVVIERATAWRSPGRIDI